MQSELVKVFHRTEIQTYRIKQSSGSSCIIENQQFTLSRNYKNCELQTYRNRVWMNCCFLSTISKRIVSHSVERIACQVMFGTSRVNCWMGKNPIPLFPPLPLTRLVFQPIISSYCFVSLQKSKFRILLFKKE